MPKKPGYFRCTIPPGTKDGGKKKDKQAKIIMGFGEQPGEGYAALNLLHQIEFGKPMERLLAPEYRELWLGMDKRRAEMAVDDQRRAVVAEKRQESAQRRKKLDKQTETISISTSSRQIIEDALLETNLLGPKAPVVDAGSSDGRKKQSNMKRELMRIGFAELDSDAASSIFTSLDDALDYLCLNLDESELPKNFTPPADIEVVQFYSKDADGRRKMVEQNLGALLADQLCVSRYSAEKALKACLGNRLMALRYLYNNLTRAKSAAPPDGDSTGELLNMAEDERNLEAEAMEAIYGDDVTSCVGALKDFDTAWACVVRLPNGAQGLRHKSALSLVVVDVDGFYPFSEPVVFVTDVESGTSSAAKLTPPQKRAATRALFSTVAAHRQASGATDAAISGEEAVAAHVVFEAASFLINSSPADVMEAAARCQIAGHRDAAEVKPVEKAGASSATGSSKAESAKWQHRVPLPRTAKPAASTPRMRAMAEKRKSLPAFNSREEILKLLQKNQVVVVSGATGSGKTTQVPQYILEKATNDGKPVSIVCTQPRRIAAVSVAERVASERGEKAGESVGFQVKLHSKKSRDTRLMFCTTGVLLRKLQSDHTLEAYTHVLVDEVHERSVETDFLLLLLKDILVKRPSLRLVLMSATLDADKFSSFFANRKGKKSAGPVPVVSIPGRTFPVEERYLEDCVALSGYRLGRGSKYAKRDFKPAKAAAGQRNPHSRTSASAAAAADDPDPTSGSEDEEGENVPESWETEEAPAPAPAVSKLTKPLSYSAADRDTIQSLDESIVNVDLINALVRKIDASTNDESKGAILIFLPGTADISNVVQELSRNHGLNRLWPLPLHSMLSPDEQAKAFMKPPKNKRKVICATNIAETSITVDDVTVVIDSLKEKEMSYDSLNNTSVLQEEFISKAAARQRAGRAGRVAKGTAYRLVRRHTFDNKLKAQQTPEIMRVALEHVVVNFLSIAEGVSKTRNPHAFLARAIDPPEPQAITSAVKSLVELGALRQLEAAATGGHDIELTALGRHLSGLPVDARIGKLLIFGVLLNCLDTALTVAASISERSPFFSPFDKREESRIARDAFAWGKSDLLTYVRAFNRWREVRGKTGGGYAAEMDFCEKSFLSRKTLMAIKAQRTQLANALADAGFGLGDSPPRRWEEMASINENSSNTRVVKAVICAALYPNIMRIDSPNATYTEVIAGAVESTKFNAKDLKMRSRTGERLFLHPAGVNFQEGNYGSKWLAFFGKVKTSRVFVRDSTSVSPYAILLFGGKIEVLHERGQITVDGWMYFKAPARVAVLVRELRRQMDELLQKKFENPGVDMNLEGRGVHNAITQLIKTEYR